MPAYLAVLREISPRLQRLQSMPPLPRPSPAGGRASLIDISAIAFGH